MTNRLVINFPNSTFAVSSDDIDKLNILSDFCKKELGAYHSTENVDEFTVDCLNVDLSNKFYSLAFELGLI